MKDSIRFVLGSLRGKVDEISLVTHKRHWNLLLTIEVYGVEFFGVVVLLSFSGPRFQRFFQNGNGGLGLHYLLDIRELHDGKSRITHEIVKWSQLFLHCKRFESTVSDLASDNRHSQQILFNKAVLDQMKFPFPMFLTTWHMIFATILTQIMSRTTNMLPGVKEVWSQTLKTFDLKLKTVGITFPSWTPCKRQKKVDGKALRTQILPVALTFAISLVLSNKAYIYLSVSYIQVFPP